MCGDVGQDVHFYKNHMIKYVRLTGVVVAMDEFPGRVVVTVDDSSGSTIEATCAAPLKAEPTSLTTIIPTANTSAPQELISPDGPNLTNIDVGSVVKIKGGIGIFREQKQIRLKSIVTLADTNAEVKCWNDVVKFRREVLSSPWIVSQEEEERCRVEDDREAKWKKEEEVKRKKDGLRKQLKERDRELREKLRQEGREAEGGKSRDDSERRTRLRELRKQRQRRHEVENSGGSEDVEKKNKLKEKTVEGLAPENRVNYPSKAARRRAAGKYDALGI
jgi:hypothetical protein